MAQTRKVGGGDLVISSNVDVRNAGWPIAADQASSNMFIMEAGNIGRHSRRASSADISSTCNCLPPWPDPNYAIDESWAVVDPYGTDIRGGNL